MKTVTQTLVLVATLTLSSLAYGGDYRYTCKSADGSIVMNRDSAVVLEKDKQTKQSEMTILTHDASLGPSKGDIVKFSSEVSGAFGELKVTAISAKKTIASETGVCPDGSKNGLGFSTEAFSIRVQTNLIDNESKSIVLSCVETAYWAGRCQFED
jgi:hypothetical protein